MRRQKKKIKNKKFKPKDYIFLTAMTLLTPRQMS